VKQDAHGRWIKDLPGEYRLEQKSKSRERKADEQAIMREAVRMDEGKCRVPRCEFRLLKVDPAHLREGHRGRGGNPAGDRTTLETIIALCRRHHWLYDHFHLDIEQLEPAKGFRGLCAYYLDGQHIGSDKRIGVSVTRSAS
jgi:hypothetical protein